jgi:hypothetical protein
MANGLILEGWKPSPCVQTSLGLMTNWKSEGSRFSDQGRLAVSKVMGRKLRRCETPFRFLSRKALATVSAKTKIDEIRPLVGGISWNRYFNHQSVVRCIHERSNIYY